MRYIRFERLAQDTKDMPNGEIFTVYTQEKSNIFLKTEERPYIWAFGMKMKANISLSKWQHDNADEKQIIEAMKQIMIVKKWGWSNTGEMKMDDLGERKKLHHCVYCGNSTLEVEGPCICRRVDDVPEPKVKTLNPFEAL